MASVQLSGMIPSVAGSGSTGAGPVAPAARGSGGDGSAVPRGPIPTLVPAAKSESNANTAAASPDKTTANAAVPGADPALEAIGTQMVLVFDDQTRTMTVKMLDIETQKVVQDVPSQKAPAPARAPSGPSTSGVLVDTKA